MPRRKATVKEKVVKALREARGEPLRPSRIAAVAGANYNSVRRVLYELLREGVATRYMGGYILSIYKVGLEDGQEGGENV